MKKWLFGLGFFLCVALGACAICLKMMNDKEAPVISFSDQLTYYDGITEEELLRDVSAVDEAEGDVSDTLVVESVTDNNSNNTVIVMYAARDSKNNIAKASRTFPYAGQANEDENAQAIGTEADSIRVGVGVALPEDSEEAAADETEGQSETEGDSELETEEPETEKEEPQPGGPRIELTENHVTVKKGDNFEPLTYVDSVEDDFDNIYDLWRDIQVEGEYDTGKTGEYKLVYYVVDSSGNRSNRAYFVLTVEE